MSSSESREEGGRASARKTARGDFHRSFRSLGKGNRIEADGEKAVGGVVTGAVGTRGSWIKDGGLSARGMRRKAGNRQLETSGESPSKQRKAHRQSTERPSLMLDERPKLHKRKDSPCLAVERTRR